MLFLSISEPQPSSKPVLDHLVANLEASLCNDFQGLADSNND
jgi:hypothetical protein